MWPKNSCLVLIFWLNCLLIYRIEMVESNEVAKALCGLTTDKLINYYGYEAEIHNITTEDGYILKVFRCNSRKASKSVKRPVLLQHGNFGSSDDFCIDGPSQALAYILADAGYDVWLGNARGNFYSRKHISKNPNANFSDYWDFSWYEMGIYDLPTVIDYILQKDSASKLHYVGFSQGTTSLMVLLSEKPEYNDKIHVANFLAPVGYMYHAGIIIKLASSTVLPMLEPLKGFEFFPRSTSIEKLRNAVCATDVRFCDLIGAFIFGPSKNQRNDTMTPVFFCYFPSGASFKQVMHYAQQTNYDFFGKFMTGSKVPPDFELAKITAPIAIHYATTDPFGDPKDVEKLMTKLKNVVFVQRINLHLFSHIDFIWGKDAASLIYSKVLNVFKKFK